MVSIYKILGLMSCGFLLWLGLSHTVQAGDAAPADPTGRKGGQVSVSGVREKLKSVHRIEGEVLRVEGKDFFVMGQDGQEVRLQSDTTTRKIGHITQGDRIVATVNDQNHMRSIRLTDMADMSDRRNKQTDPTMDVTLEAGKMGAVGQ